jgi:NAD(P)-dependent dehydrogenase (short-subunit alcohol dehydrogenase family)
VSGVTVLITGGNSGLGAAAATELARRKANVIIACRTHDKSLAVIEEVKARFPDSPEVSLEVLT